METGVTTSVGHSFGHSVMRTSLIDTAIDTSSDIDSKLDETKDASASVSKANLRESETYGNRHRKSNKSDNTLILACLLVGVAILIMLILIYAALVISLTTPAEGTREDHRGTGTRAFRQAENQENNSEGLTNGQRSRRTHREESRWNT